MNEPRSGPLDFIGQREADLRRLRSRRDEAHERWQHDASAAATLSEYEPYAEYGRMEVEDLDHRIEADERDLGHLLFDYLYPQRNRPDAMDPDEPDGGPLNFAKYVAFDMWDELKGCFSDKAFANNVEILAAAESRIGYAGLARLVLLKRMGGALRKADMEEAAKLCALISSEKHATIDNRLRARRGAKGQLVILIDQVGNPHYTPPYIGRPIASRCSVGRRWRSRQRGPGRKPARRRGSRRITSRSAGGGSDDPDPEPPGRPSPSRRQFSNGRFVDLLTHLGGRR